MRMSGADMAQASQGTWVRGEAPDWISGIGTDSRDFIAGHAFLALRGHAFDGHAYAAQVADKAAALIGDATGVSSWKDLRAPQLQVQDTLHALGNIAAWHRQGLTACRVVAITGSYGKTTVRAMLAHVLVELGLKVAATKENFNNLIGVPKTLMAVPDDAEVAIVECGISEVGEMTRLSEIVQPDIAIITGIGVAHGEGLGDKQGVAREKAKLLTHLLPQGWCLLGSGVRQTFAEAGCLPSHACLDMNDDSTVDYRLRGCQLSLTYQGEEAKLDLPLPARHWAEDMALVAQAALRLGQDKHKPWRLADIAQALRGWSPVSGRMRVTHGEFTLIDDSYNANPASMQVALDTLAALPGYRVAILGDMLELGAQAQALHQALALHDIDEVLTVGKLMAGLQAANPDRHIRVFPDADALAAWLQGKDFPPATSTVLVKGSHGTGVHRIAACLQARMSANKRGCHAV